VATRRGTCHTCRGPDGSGLVAVVVGLLLAIAGGALLVSTTQGPLCEYGSR
jgi:hypothetical protein